MNATHVYHKIKISGNKSKYSAWFSGDPLNDSFAHLIDCERIDSLNRSFPCSESEKSTLRNGAWSSTQWHTFN